MQKPHYGNFRKAKNKLASFVTERLMDFSVLSFMFAHVACLTPGLLYVLQTQCLWPVYWFSTRQTLPSGLYPCDLKRKYLYGATNDHGSITSIDAAVILCVFLCVCVCEALLQ